MKYITPQQTFIMESLFNLNNVLSNFLPFNYTTICTIPIFMSWQKKVDSCTIHNLLNEIFIAGIKSLKIFYFLYKIPESTGIKKIHV